jgi:cell division protein FtsQ
MRLRTPSPPPDLARPPAPEPAAALDLHTARRRSQRRSRLQRAGLVALVVALVGAAAWLVGYSSLLALRTVEVQGADDVVTAAVLEAAAAPVGVPLARVDTAAVAEQASQVPEVESVRVSRAWPHTLVLTVTPRSAVAVLQGPEGWRFVDASGALFGAPEGPTGDLPTVVAPDTETGERARVAAVDVAGALPPDLLASVERLEAGSPADVRLVLRDGRTVTWGSADDSTRKVQVLTVLLATPAAGYDLSVPDRPTVRP